MKKSIYWKLKYSNFYLFLVHHVTWFSLVNQYLQNILLRLLESRWSPGGVHGKVKITVWKVMWNGVESRWNPGGNRQKFGWAPCQINSTWTPGGLHESMWIPGGMTRNLWGSVKSSISFSGFREPRNQPKVTELWELFVNVSPSHDLTLKSNNFSIKELQLRISSISFSIS